jgi:hypothetical protein
MRRIASTAFALVLCAAPAAFGAPTCWSEQGQAVRCGTPGAMPVGARLTPAQVSARAAAPAGETSVLALAGLASVLVGIFVLIALMPDFERWER